MGIGGRPGLVFSSVTDKLRLWASFFTFLNLRILSYKKGFIVRTRDIYKKELAQFWTHNKCPLRGDGELLLL